MKALRIICSITVIIVFLSGCKKESVTAYKNVKGTLTGAAGCSNWIIRQEDGTTWEPRNLSSFQVTLKGGQPVIFSFVIDNEGGSFCMSGQLIVLTSIQNQ